MQYLYLDSSNGLTLGLLNQSLEWVHLEFLDEKKPSEIVHVKINEIINNHQLNLKNLKIISSAGPGSYTGMRLSEGIARILKVCGLETISFFQFEIPKLAGIKNGAWITNAFKGEIFIFEWDEISEQKKLMNSEKINKYTGFYSNLSEVSGVQAINTNVLLKNNSKEIFKEIIKRNAFFEAYYYRTIEEEFKPL